MASKRSKQGRDVGLRERIHGALDKALGGGWSELSPEVLKERSDHELGRHKSDQSCHVGVGWDRNGLVMYNKRTAPDSSVVVHDPNRPPPVGNSLTNPHLTNAVRQHPPYVGSGAMVRPPRGMSSVGVQPWPSMAQVNASLISAVGPPVQMPYAPSAGGRFTPSANPYMASTISSMASGQPQYPQSPAMISQPHPRQYPATHLGASAHTMTPNKYAAQQPHHQQVSQYPIRYSGTSSRQPSQQQHHQEARRGSTSSSDGSESNMPPAHQGNRQMESSRSKPSQSVPSVFSSHSQALSVASTRYMPTVVASSEVSRVPTVMASTGDMTRTYVEGMTARSEVQPSKGRKKGHKGRS